MVSDWKTKPFIWLYNRERLKFQKILVLERLNRKDITWLARGLVTSFTDGLIRLLSKRYTLFTSLYGS